MTGWVIAYDIADPRRLARVHRTMLRHATGLEYSVFVLVGSKRALDVCMSEVGRVIDKKEDDVRCYPLPARGLRERMGRSVLPAGIHWAALPAGLAL